MWVKGNFFLNFYGICRREKVEKMMFFFPNENHFNFKKFVKK